MMAMRYALRKWRANPLIAVLAIATIALAIGVSTAVFSIISAVILKPLPYKEADRLVMIWNVNSAKGFTLEQQRVSGSSMSPDEFQDWQQKSGVFENMVAFGSWFGSFTDEQPEVFFGYQVSSGVFDLIGTTPLVGRPFSPDEQKTGGQPALVLQHDFWRRRFNEDPSIVGKTIKLNNRLYTVAGVMPPRFVFFNRQIDAMVTLHLGDLKMPRGVRFLRVLARLKTGATLEQTQAQADAFAAGLARAYPQSNEGWSPTLVPVGEDVAGDLRPGLLVLLGGVGCVLLIMCANVANLLLVQATGRAKELAVRTALGASRWRIVRQLILESIGLALVGGIIGLAIAYVLVSYFQALLPDRYAWGKYLVQAEALQVDARVISFAVFSAVATGFLFGLRPALYVTRRGFYVELQDATRGSVGGRRTGAMRKILVVCETAICVVLVIGAGLLVESFLVLQRQGSGFQGRGILTVNIWMPTDDLEALTRDMPRPEGEKIWQAAMVSFDTRLTRELAALPGVQAVSGATQQPISAFYRLTSFNPEGRIADQNDELKAIVSIVAPNYFEVVGLPITGGQSFGIEHRPGTSAVAVVSESAARAFWPGERAVGKRFRRIGDERPDPWITVVGVAGDIREDGLHKPPKPYVYLSLVQQQMTGFYYFIKPAGSGDSYALLPAIHQAARRTDPRTIVYRPRTLDDLVRDSTWHLNYSMVLLGGLAWLALFLALIGTYGVLSTSVRERTSEIGLRMTLGAGKAEILQLIAGQGLRLTASGAAIGIFIAFVLTRYLKTQLYGVEASDPVIFIAVPVSFLAMGLLASFVPARRALQIDPLAALRHE
jgi:putative ABC transport system permease protein